MEPVPDIDELTWLFEDGPVGAEGWQREFPHTEVAFRTTRAGVAVSLALAIDYEDARLVISGAAAPEVDLSLHDVQAVEVERLHGAEVLVLRFRPSAALEPLRLVLKPTLSLRWSIGFHVSA